MFLSICSRERQKHNLPKEGYTLTLPITMSPCALLWCICGQVRIMSQLALEIIEPQNNPRAQNKERNHGLFPLKYRTAPSLQREQCTAALWISGTEQVCAGGCVSQGCENAVPVQCEVSGNLQIHSPSSCAWGPEGCEAKRTGRCARCVTGPAIPGGTGAGSARVTAPRPQVLPTATALLLPMTAMDLNRGFSLL